MLGYRGLLGESNLSDFNRAASHTHTVVMKGTKDHYAASVVPQRVSQKQVDCACLVVIFMPI